MRKILFFYMVCINFSVAQKVTDNASLQKPKILFSKDTTMLPYPLPYTNGYYEAEVMLLDMEDRKNSSKIIELTLNKYPPSLISVCLKNIYIFKYLYLDNFPYGGTYSYRNKNILLTYAYKEQSNYHLEEIFHHELSSLLLRTHLDMFDADAWELQNEIDYLDITGMDSIKVKTNAFSYDTLFNNKGFLNSHGQTCLEDDFNSFAQSAMSNKPEFWEVVKKYPRIREKAKIFLRFYYTIDIEFKKLIPIPEWFKVDE